MQLTTQSRFSLVQLREKEIEDAAKQKFVKIILDRYINYKNEDFEEIKKEMFKAVDAVKDNFYESEYGDTLVILKQPLIEQ